MTSPGPLAHPGPRRLRALPNGTVPAEEHRPLVFTSGFLAAQTKIAITVDSRRICALDGDFGTGKSTAVGYYAEQSGRLCRRVEIPSDATSKEALVHVHVQLTGHEPVGSKMMIRRDLYEVLSSDEYVVLLDEAQNLGAPGLRQVRNLWDTCRRMGRPFPLVISGAGIIAALERVPEVKSRVTVRHTMTRLPTAEVVDAVRGMHPRLAAADEDLILLLDSRFALGNLRQWDHFLAALDTVAGPPEPRTAAVPLVRRLARLTLDGMGYPEVKL